MPSLARQSSPQEPCLNVKAPITDRKEVIEGALCLLNTVCIHLMLAPLKQISFFSVWFGGILQIKCNPRGLLRARGSAMVWTGTDTLFKCGLISSADRG